MRGYVDIYVYGERHGSLLLERLLTGGDRCTAWMKGRFCDVELGAANQVSPRNGWLFLGYMFQGLYVQLHKHHPSLGLSLVEDLYTAFKLPFCRLVVSYNGDSL